MKIMMKIIMKIIIRRRRRTITLAAAAAAGAGAGAGAAAWDPRFDSLLHGAHAGTCSMCARPSVFVQRVFESTTGSWTL